MNRKLVFVSVLVALLCATHSRAEAPNESPAPTRIPGDPPDKVAPWPGPAPAPSLKMPAVGEADQTKAIKTLKAAAIRFKAVAEQAQRDLDAVLQNQALKAENEKLDTKVQELERTLAELKNATQSSDKSLAAAQTVIRTHEATIDKLTRQKTDMAASATTRSYGITALFAVIFLLSAYALRSARKCRMLKQAVDDSDSLLAKSRTDASERHTKSLAVKQKEHDKRLAEAVELITQTRQTLQGQIDILQREKTELERKLEKAEGQLTFLGHDPHDTDPSGSLGDVVPAPGGDPTRGTTAMEVVADDDEEKKG